MRRNKITVIEDDADLKILVQMALKSHGYDVRAGHDETALAGYPAEASDLYILDINLGSGISGANICKQIKEQYEGAQPPVVILISANPDLRHMAADARADDTLSKPFSTIDLLKKISAHLPLNSQDPKPSLEPPIAG